MTLPTFYFLLMAAVISGPLQGQTPPDPSPPGGGLPVKSAPLPLPDPASATLVPPLENPPEAPALNAPAGMPSLPPSSPGMVSAIPLEEFTTAPAVEPTAPLPHAVGPVFPMPALPADGYWVEAAPLNEVFQYLARKADVQYFYNNNIATPEYQLTGHLRFDDPVQQMDDVALVFGLTVYRQGSTVFAMTEQQLAKLPMEVMSYPLKYLRGSRPSPSSSGSGAPAAGGGGRSQAAAWPISRN